jgi:hypothetical protein
MKKVILDTNFLLIPNEFKVDIFTEIKRIAPTYKLYIIDGTIDELNTIIERKGTKDKDKLNAKIGLQLIEQKKVAIIKGSEKIVDDSIVHIANSDTIVATSDRELRQRLRKNKIQLISLRKKQYLTLS